MSKLVKGGALLMRVKTRATQLSRKVINKAALVGDSTSERRIGSQELRTVGILRYRR
jgi:hypothetical protein